MGKEVSGARRIIGKRRWPRRDVSSIEPQKELAIQWDPKQEVVSQTQVAENGGVVVTIKTTTSEKVVACTGFSRRGNKYSHLVKILRRKNLIPSRARINSILLDRGFVDVRADPNKECFFAGDRLILLLNGASHRIAKVSMVNIKKAFFNLNIPHKRKHIKKPNRDLNNNYHM